MKICNLGSGSRGNATFVDFGSTKILIDNGFSIKELTYRMHSRDIRPEEVDCLIVSHAHRDHFDGVGRWGRRFGTPIYTTRSAVYRYERLLNKTEIHYYTPGKPFKLNGVRINPVSVPHDVNPTVGFIMDDDNVNFAIFTDLGTIPDSLSDLLQEVDTLFIEANHDVEMLLNGPYPPDLQDRILSDRGHLSNEVTAEFLRQNSFSERLKFLFLGHLSQENNDPFLVKDLFEEVIDEHPVISPVLVITNQYEPTEIYSIKEDL